MFDQQGRAAPISGLDHLLHSRKHRTAEVIFTTTSTDHFPSIKRDCRSRGPGGRAVRMGASAMVASDVIGDMELPPDRLVGCFRATRLEVIWRWNSCWLSLESRVHLVGPCLPDSARPGNWGDSRWTYPGWGRWIVAPSGWVPLRPWREDLAAIAANHGGVGRLCQRPVRGDASGVGRCVGSMAEIATVKVVYFLMSSVRCRSSSVVWRDRARDDSVRRGRSWGVLTSPVK